MVILSHYRDSGEQIEEIPFPGLSVIIPAYNEKDGISPVLHKTLDVLAHLPGPTELLVVDDGSTDETAFLADEIDGVRVMRHRFNRGYGASLKTGIRHARYPLICITDADGTYPNERIPDLLECILQHDADMAVGARVGENVAVLLVRKPAKWMIQQLGQFVANEKIPDINSGLRIFKRSAVTPFLSILPSTFSFTTTITLAMLTNGYQVEFLPINYFARVGKSKIRPIHDTVNFFLLVTRIALYFVPLKIFLPLSGMLLVLAAIWGFYSWSVLGRLADVSTLIITLAAFQIAVLGMLAELINRRLSGFHRG